jgi:hypothetical protein
VAITADHAGSAGTPALPVRVSGRARGASIGARGEAIPAVSASHRHAA